MIRPSSRPCPDHRRSLVAWADRREIGPGTAAALAHLDSCRDCEAEVTRIRLTIHAMRTIASEAAAVEPSRDAWPRLRARVDQPRRAPWQWRTTLGGTLVSTLIVAVVVGAGGGITSFDRQLIAPSMTTSVSREEHAIETAYISARVARTGPSGPRSMPASIPRQYPDGVRPGQKEVNRNNADRRPLAAI